MLYAFGSNGCGQLGLGHTDDTSSPSRVQVYSESSILQIAAGGNHTLVLLNNGDVYTFGNNDAEQANDVDVLDVRVHMLQSTKLVSGMAGNMSVRVVQVAATWSASLFLCSNGSLISIGEGSSGELGLGRLVTEVSQPTFIQTVLPEDVRFVQIASSMAHTVAVTSDGQAWGWGRGRKGQLGEPAQHVWEPKRIDSVKFPVVKAVCGKDFTCLIGAKSTGEVAILGPNRNDRFGVQAYAPTAVPGWKDIVASWGSVYITKDNGDVVTWGRNDHGQLPCADLPPVEALAAGSEHCLALTKAGEVVAWGWGEHGNCGRLTDQSGDVKARFNSIPVNGDVTAVFAGCATSFVATRDTAQALDHPCSR